MVTLQTMVNSKAAKAILAGDTYTMATGRGNLDSDPPAIRVLIPFVGFEDLRRVLGES